MDLQGKTALITGGAHRVGGAITRALAAAGANVVINYRSSADAAEAMAEEVRALGVGAHPFQADVTDAARVQAMVDAATERFGSVDVLVNSASLFKPTPLPMDDYADWHYVTNILLDGPLYCANAVAPGMLERGRGVILNIIDLSAWEPWPNFAAHSVGKAGLLALTRQLALDLAPDVRANAIAPGPVLPPPDYSEEKIARTGKKTLLNRWGEATDVSDAVLFLVRADYITGETITIDGGERYGHRKAGD
jgi:3-oxoacyl-[acyl-carrier protein] reductase/pteridine reductase